MHLFWVKKNSNFYLQTQKDKKPTTTIDFTKTPLDLYKIGNFIGESENSTVTLYTLPLKKHIEMQG